MRRRYAWVGIILFLVWIAVIASAFYIVPQQRPFNAAQLRAWGSFARAIVTMAAIAGGGLSAGLGLLRWLKISSDDALTPFLFAATVGLGLVSVAMLVVGLLGGATWWGALGVLVASWLVAGRRAVGVLKQLAISLPRWLNRLGRWGQIYTLITVGIPLLAALLPPTDFDGLFYHLTGPKLAIEAGRIGWMGRYTPHFNFPWFGESLYLQAMLLGNDLAAKLLHWWALILLMGWVVWFARQRLGREAVSWSLLLLLAMPMTAVLAGWAYTDLFLTLFVTAETALLAEAFAGQKGAAWYGLAGLVSGFAIGVKYTAVLWPIAGLGLVIVYNLVTRQPAARRVILAYVLGGVLGGLPWLVKNLALTGNPAYPFLWGGPQWDAFRMAWYEDAGSGLWGNWRATLLMPLLLTQGIRDMNFYDGRTGPLWLIMLPLVVIWSVKNLRRPSDQRWPWVAVLILGGAHAASWVWGVLHTRGLFQSRLLLPALVVYGWLATAAFLSTREAKIGALSLHNFLKLCIGLVLVGNVLYQINEIALYNPARYLMGIETRVAYLERVMGSHWQAMQALNALPPESQTLLLWEPRSYYAPTSTQPDAILDRWAHLHYLYGDARSIADALRAEGITHILLSTRGMNFVRQSPNPPLLLSAESWLVLDEFLETLTVPVMEMDTYVLYTWK